METIYIQVSETGGGATVSIDTWGGLSICIQFSLKPVGSCSHLHYSSCKHTSACCERAVTIETVARVLVRGSDSRVKWASVSAARLTAYRCGSKLQGRKNIYKRSHIRQQKTPKRPLTPISYCTMHYLGCKTVHCYSRVDVEE